MKADSQACDMENANAIEHSLNTSQSIPIVTVNDVAMVEAEKFADDDLKLQTSILNQQYSQFINGKTSQGAD